MRIIRFIKALWRYIWFGHQVTFEEYMLRLDKCRSCEYLERYDGSCNKCGCYVLKKAKMSTEKCPDGKWLEKSI
jgi:hypothetical protein